MNAFELKNVAKNVRASIIEEVFLAKSGHPGGSLSVADILTVLYFDKMNINSRNPKWEDRDRLVLSKGHAAPALYAVLAEKGYFPKENLKTLRKLGSMLQGHPDMNVTPGVDMSTGSLGQGLSAANGMALAAKLDKKDHKIFVILGDGEVQEGQVWEAAMSSAHYKLDNVIAILDHNGLQIDGSNEEVMSISPIDEKFAAFGWKVIKINGHDMEAIGGAIEEAKLEQDKPTIII
ncbi:MAG: transketolase, partial [Clostridiaceae bacterium]|nr:transketolase [Clostridiaceae bacterium]